MRAYERLLKEGERSTPSTERQKDLSRILADEMTAMGLQEVYVDENAYTYGVLPAAEGMEDKPCIGLIAHLDTIPDEDFPGFGVKPQLVANYDGGALALGESGRVLSPDQFPDLKTLCGHTLITTDGTTVLGADDKAGIAEILTACEILKKEKRGVLSVLGDDDYPYAVPMDFVYDNISVIETNASCLQEKHRL